MRTADVEAMQKGLTARGLYEDKIDGKIGPSTRLAVRGWQASAGYLADGYPTAAQLKQMGAVP